MHNPVSAQPVIALVPVRAGSVGLPGKNTRPLLGVPLFRRAIDQALAAGAQAVVVSTDIPEILDWNNRPSNVLVHPRPRSLSQSDTTMDEVIEEVTRLPIFAESSLLLLQATSPLRRVEQIREGIDRFDQQRPGLLMSVVQTDSSILKCGTLDTDGRFRALRSTADPFQNRQSLPAVYRPNGAIYVVSVESFRERGTLATADITVLEMSAEDSIDIDDIGDFERCEAVLRTREGEKDEDSK